MMIRLGLPLTGGALVAAARQLGAPLLISANAFSRRYSREDWWNEPWPGFRTPNGALAGLDVALDSAGFVAMVKYNGFPWTVTQYVTLAGSFPWAWWSAMDCCCEPEVAKDRDEVMLRVAETARLLGECRREAEHQGVEPPMPIVQGWHPDDYARCADLLPLWEWPELVGVGSVCRRDIPGDTGLLAVVERLDRVLDPHVKLHLFGVKGPAMGLLAEHPRVAAVDSQAWDFQARKENRGNNTMPKRIVVMRRWWETQQALVTRERRTLFDMPIGLRPAATRAKPADLLDDDWQDLIAGGEIEARCVTDQMLWEAKYCCCSDIDDDVDEGAFSCSFE